MPSPVSNQVRQPDLAFAMVGDVTDPGVASGTPYFALTHAQRHGLTARGLRLGTQGRSWQRHRALWNLKQLALTGQRGGYQYSEAFLERLWQADPPAEGEDVINMFQLYPAKVMEQHSGRKCFYVDQTLKQMFDTYGLENAVPATIMTQAMARERTQYQRADLVFTQSAYAANSVIQDYGVAKDKVHAVVCGANLEPELLDSWDAEGRPTQAPGPLRLVFVGKDWQRKGLDRLIEAMIEARTLGAEVELRVLGVQQSDLPEPLAAVPGIEWVGFVDKRHDARRFIDLVASCDVGCLLSNAEAGGMSLREFCRLGLVTLAPAVGGSPEYVVPGASHLITADADAKAIAAILHRLASEPATLTAQRDIAWAARGDASWAAPVAKIAHILSETSK